MKADGQTYSEKRETATGKENMAKMAMKKKNVGAEGNETVVEYYHGTRPQYLESILAKGLKPHDLNYYDEESGTMCPQRFSSCLGHGVYISRNWRTSLFFGSVLLRVQIKEGTRILEISDLPDPAVLDSLKREFGNGLFSSKMEFRKIIPRNKQLKLSELVELTRFHYYWTWGAGALKKPVEQYHFKSLTQCMAMLRRFKFDGYGDADDDVGIMVFSRERLVVKELVAVIDIDKDIPLSASLDDAKAYFRRHGDPHFLAIADDLRKASGGELT